MSDFLSMFDYSGKTAQVLGKSRINTYKDIYSHIDKEQGNSLKYNGEYLGDILLNSLSNASKNYIRGIIEENYQEESLLGDVNGDTLINVQDIVLIVNLVLSAGYDSAADLNSDGITNVLDIVQIVNIILS